jgi:hypothetical protein
MATFPRETARRAMRVVVDLLAVAGSVWFVASQLPWRLLFTSTIANGGDMGSPLFTSATCYYLRGASSDGVRGTMAASPCFSFTFPFPSW